MAFLKGFKIWNENNSWKTTNTNDVIILLEYDEKIEPIVKTLDQLIHDSRKRKTYSQNVRSVNP